MKFGMYDCGHHGYMGLQELVRYKNANPEIRAGTVYILKEGNDTKLFTETPAEGESMVAGWGKFHGGNQDWDPQSLKGRRPVFNPAPVVAWIRRNEEGQTTELAFRLGTAKTPIYFFHAIRFSTEEPLVGYLVMAGKKPQNYPTVRFSLNEKLWLSELEALLSNRRLWMTAEDFHVLALNTSVSSTNPKHEMYNTYRSAGKIVEGDLGAYVIDGIRVRFSADGANLGMGTEPAAFRILEQGQQTCFELWTDHTPTSNWFPTNVVYAYQEPATLEEKAKYIKQKIDIPLTDVMLLAMMRFFGTVCMPNLARAAAGG